MKQRIGHQSNLLVTYLLEVHKFALIDVQHKLDTISADRVPAYSWLSIFELLINPRNRCLTIHAHKRSGYKLRVNGMSSDHLSRYFGELSDFASLQCSNPGKKKVFQTYS